VPNPLAQIEDLAAAAEAHASREHGASIGSDDVAAADRILDAEARTPDLPRARSLGACYGAWIGRLAVRRWNAEWIGLSEPAAPRLRIGGVVASPIDAVQRRLLDASSPPLVEIVRRFETWSRPERVAASVNRDAWDRLAGDARFAGAVDLPPDPEAALDEWVRAEGVRGKRVLCLGAGGGRQGPLLARAGASVTVVDFSERQLDHDRRAAELHALDLRAVCATLDDLRELGDGTFDLIVQPVSSCYVPDLPRAHAEAARVLRPGGLYVVQHKQPAALQAGEDLRIAHPYVEGSALPPSPAAHREPGTTEYLHTLEALLGGLCRAGFVIEDVVEPPRGDALAPEGSPEHRAGVLPPYLKVKARRR
jgi:SAM-dependent methyltransferase